MGISDNVQLALIVAIPPLIAVPVTAWFTNRNLLKSKAAEASALEQAKRLDAEIRRAEKDEDAARTRREREEDKRAAKELLDQTAKTADAAVATANKMEEVHVLVNSNYTAALEATYEALQAKLVILLESVTFKRTHGTEPEQEVITDIEATKRRVAALRATIDERLRKDEDTLKLKKKIAETAIQGAAQERAPAVNRPLPVADSRTAVASERTATASERVASAAERSADVVEKEATDKEAAAAIRKGE